MGDIPLTLWNLASGFGGIADPPSTLLGLVLVLIVGIGLAGTARGLGLRFALVGLLLPIVGVWLISQRRPVYVDRYFVVVLPFVVALVALGVDSVARRISRAGPHRATWVLAAVAAGLVVLSAGLTVHTAQKFTKEDWRGLAAFLKSQSADADALSLSEPEIALPLSYYFDERLLRETPSPSPRLRPNVLGGAAPAVHGDARLHPDGERGGAQPRNRSAPGMRFHQLVDKPDRARHHEGRL